MLTMRRGEGLSGFNLAARIAGYVGAMELVLMEERGVLDRQEDLLAADGLRREEYSPIFAVMNKADRRVYDSLCAEIEAAGHIELIGNNKPELSKEPGDDLCVSALHECRAPLLAHLVGEASLKPF